MVFLLVAWAALGVSSALLAPRRVARPLAVRSATDLKPYLSTLIGGTDLSSSEARELFGAFFDGGAAPEQIAAVLCLLRQKGETCDEIAGAATAMLDNCVRVHVSDREKGLLDIVGTGGDGASTINLSTASAIVAAAAGARVTKCGNRSVSSKCGAADVLEVRLVCDDAFEEHTIQALGLDLELPLASVAQCIEACGLGFLYAPQNHPAMKNVAPVRKALGVRTAFNLLGPLTNAAGANRVVIGVFDEALVELLAGALAKIGAVDHAVVVHGVGLDEISPLGPCTVVELKRKADGEYEKSSWILEPLDYGIPRCSLEDLKGGDADYNALALRECLAAAPDSDARRDAIALNAAMGLYVYGAAPTLAESLELARGVLRSGAALAKLDEWIAMTKALKA
ncbi:glycosyl transferase family, a/b domain-containing protein [Pelagophyceae sp. CCMP2097]|nr:glycosyl transferase family, a/b domain-containing protein [Pelagophyceae sp. CCMP2097]